MYIPNKPDAAFSLVTFVIQKRDTSATFVTQEVCIQSKQWAAFSLLSYFCNTKKTVGYFSNMKQATSCF